MINNFQQFNENSQIINPKECEFTDHDYTIIKDRIYPLLMLKDIVIKLKTMKLNDEFSLSIIKINTDKSGIEIIKKIKKKYYTVFYYWDDDVWVGGYEHATDNFVTDSYGNMSIEEFIGCLYNDNIITENQFEELIEFIQEIKHKYRGSITGSKFGI